MDLKDESEGRSKVAKDVCAFTGKNSSPTDCHKVQSVQLKSGPRTKAVNISRQMLFMLV
jgi:hypothetical protein